MSDTKFHFLLNKLDQFKRKYFLNNLLKGIYTSAVLTLAAFLLISFFEYIFHLDKPIRAFLFYTFIGSLIVSLAYFVIIPFLKIINWKKNLTNEKAAVLIGSHFKNIDDRLLNSVQLMSKADNELAMAALSRQAVDFQSVIFEEAVDTSKTNRFLKILLLFLVTIVSLAFIVPKLIWESPQHVFQYNKEFQLEAPFTWNIESDLLAFRNEDYKLDVNLKGKSVPDQLYISYSDRKIKMDKNPDGTFNHTFSKPQKTLDFTLEGSGYNSSTYTLKVVERPGLNNYSALLNYPDYLNRKSEVVHNASSLNIPEGTVVDWNFNITAANEARVRTSTGEVAMVEASNYTKKYKNDENFSLSLINEYSKNTDSLEFAVTILKDEFPKITTEQVRDTVLYKQIYIGGNLTDDYGISNLKLFYKTAGEQDFKAVTIGIEKGRAAQNFYYKWNLDSLHLSKGENLEYFIKVWDNDQENGYKSTKTSTFVLKIPDEKSISESFDKSAQKSESDLKETIKESKTLAEELENLSNKLKSKKNLSWQERKQLEDLIKKRENMMEDIKKLQQDVEKNNERFNQLNDNEKLAEKAKELEKLMNELLDEETKKLYEELQKLMNQNINNDQLQKALDKIKRKQGNLEKELERALSMFKQMKFEQKLDQTIKNLDKVEKQQTDLLNKTQDKKANMDSLAKQQDEVKEKTEGLKEEMKDLEELNKDIEEKQNLEPEQLKLDSASMEMDKAKENLEKKNQKKAAENEKKASDKMKEMKQKLSEMQNQMEMEGNEENMQDLRQILENLITLSFDQESLMKDLKGVHQSDPRYVDLSQKQLKIKDDAKIIEDSLLSLANRVFQIRSFVTREVSDMNANIDESLDLMRKRRPAVAAGKQQFAMTSMNNLALMLNDVLKQMQEQMQQSKGSGKKQKKGNQSLSEMQKQLNQQMEQLMKSGKSGKSLSEELAKMAAEQEMIRNALKEMEEKNKGQEENGKTPGGTKGIQDQMEKSETDLVNKKISQETINRQKDILTKLLEAEKSLREREMDPKREATSGKEIDQQIPPEFEKYLKEKEKQVEYLKTVPPSLNPYYKKEVQDYFKKINK